MFLLLVVKKVSKDPLQNEIHKMWDIYSVKMFGWLHTHVNNPAEGQQIMLISIKAKTSRQVLFLDRK